MKPFNETQRMTQWWLWLVLSGLAGIWVWGIVQQIGLGKPFGDKPMSDGELILSFLLPLGLLGFFRLLTLKTTVDERGIRISYRPLWRTQLRWDEIQDVRLETYSGFIGYGIRFTGTYGTVYNAKGNRGLLIRKKNGRRLMIGTQQSDALLLAVRTYLAAR